MVYCDHQELFVVYWDHQGVIFLLLWFCAYPSSVEVIVRWVSGYHSCVEVIVTEFGFVPLPLLYRGDCCFGFVPCLLCRGGCVGERSCVHLTLYLQIPR